MVTGSTGFVGRALCARLIADGWAVRATVRGLSATSALPAGTAPFATGELDRSTPWDEALAGAEVVFHLAARVHIMREEAVDPVAEYHRVNVEATGHLARRAVGAGVARFVFVSSAKVHGEGREAAYTEDDEPRPADPYAASKLHAEQELGAVASGTGMRAAILRPPLVYGPGVRANFLQLLRAVDRGVPLPLGAVTNQRSLVGIDNLVDAMVACAVRPMDADRTFLVADGQDVSTSGLVRALSVALGRPPRLLSIPPSLIRATARLLHQSAAAGRLLGSFAVDSSRIRRELSWTPPAALADGLARTVAWYRSSMQA